jgi:hypothetical protein
VFGCVQTFYANDAVPCVDVYECGAVFHLDSLALRFRLAGL